MNDGKEKGMKEDEKRERERDKWRQEKMKNKERCRADERDEQKLRSPTFSRKVFLFFSFRSDYPEIHEYP